MLTPPRCDALAPDAGPAGVAARLVLHACGTMVHGRMPAMIHRHEITGLVLAGGRGSRMGGLDKGLQTYHGRPLAWNALQRLAPQVGALAVNANRHLADYAALGAPVWPDTLPDQPGPLAGMLAGLAQCRTRWLVTVPCDSPNFPDDMVARLAAALATADSELAVVTTPDKGHDPLDAMAPQGMPAMLSTQVSVAAPTRRQPVFCLLGTDLRDSLAAFLAAGERKVGRWMGQHRCVEVLFDEADAFVNANTLEDLRRVQGG